MKTFYKCDICGRIYDSHDDCYEHEKVCSSYYIGHYFKDSVFNRNVIYVEEMVGDKFKCVLFSPEDTPDKHTHQMLSTHHLCNRANRRLTKEDVKELIDSTPAPI